MAVEEPKAWLTLFALIGVLVCMYLAGIERQLRRINKREDERERRAGDAGR